MKYKGLWSDGRPAYGVKLPYATTVVVDFDAGELFFRPPDDPGARITLAANLRQLVDELEGKVQEDEAHEVP